MQTSALELETGTLELRDPVLLVALHGYFDIAGVATSAVEAAFAAGSPLTIGAIDCDGFFDFSMLRPDIAFGDDGPTVSWPDTAIQALPTSGARDVVAIVGYEPHLDWAAYVDCVLAVVARLDVGLVVTLGAAAEVTPHTRMPTVVGSTSDARLAARFGLQPPSYQGITGLIGVLHAALDRLRRPSVSLRVGVPHYLGGGEHPRAVTSLVQHLAHVLDVPLDVDLADEIRTWDEIHDNALADDSTMTSYVRVLEREYDRRAEASLSSGDELAEQFQRFLRDDDR